MNEAVASIIERLSKIHDDLATAQAESATLASDFKSSAFASHQCGKIAAAVLIVESVRESYEKEARE